MLSRLTVLLCVSVLGSTFATGAFPALLPDLDRAGYSTAELGALTAAFGFARMVVDVPVGLVIRRRLGGALIAAPLVLAVGIGAIATGEGLRMLLLGRMLMGIGHSLGMVGWLTLILHHERRALGTALNAFEFSGMLGMLGGMAILGWLPARLPWNMAFLIAAAPQVLALAVLPFVLASLPPKAASATDAGGSTGATGTPAVTAGAAIAARTPRRDTWDVGLAFAAGPAIAVTYATMQLFLIPLRAGREFGLDRAGAAEILILAQITDVVCLLPVGYLADRAGASRVLAMALAALAASSILVGYGGLAVMTVGAAVCGGAMAAWMLPLTLVRRVTRPADLAWRTALYRVGVDAGLFAGPFVSGLMGDGVTVLPAVLAAVLLTLLILMVVPAPLRIGWRG